MSSLRFGRIVFANLGSVRGMFGENLGAMTLDYTGHPASCRIGTKNAQEFCRPTMGGG